MISFDKVAYLLKKNILEIRNKKCHILDKSIHIKHKDEMQMNVFANEWKTLPIPSESLANLYRYHSAIYPNQKRVVRHELWYKRTYLHQISPEKLLKRSKINETQVEFIYPTYPIRMLFFLRISDFQVNSNFIASWRLRHYVYVNIWKTHFHKNFWVKFSAPNNLNRLSFGRTSTEIE